MREIEIGAQVSHYRLVRRIGAGGMGAVFLAQDLTLDRPVAIKFLIAPDDDRSRKRLLREARAAAALDHEYIGAVYEVGTDDQGGDFIVMQYVDGETLASRLRRGRMPPATALTIGRRIAEALAVAHRRAIVHRDLKPHNIVLTPSGVPKLLDFGLARRLISSGPAAAEATVSQLTQKGALVGTPSYMAPEQVRGQPVDARSDVFALGCVLYECLTGRRAFTGSTVADILGQVLHVDPAPVSSMVPELGPAYDALCSRLLSKSVEERFQSAEEVLGAIQALADTARLTSENSARFVSATSQMTRMWALLSPRTRSVAILATVALAIGGVAAWPLYRGGGLPEPPTEAARWYSMGLDALRDGTYAGARDRFNEAVRIFPDYVQAYSGSALAYRELDNESAAQAALLRVNQLLPDRTRLSVDDRLRLEAVLASVQGNHDQAIAIYQELAERHPLEPGAWLDLGRAHEAADRGDQARTAYEKALALDRHSAAAHVRLGILRVRAGRRKEAVAFFDEAIRLYQAGSNVEGEAEALVRKGLALSNAGELAAAREALERAALMAGDRYLSQSVRARFELARVAVAEGDPGNFAAVEGVTEESVREASDKGLYALAAGGRIDLANVFALGGRLDRADGELARAIQIAGDHGARRTEMRARLQRASFRLVAGEPAEAISLAEPAVKFFSEGHYLRQEADAKNIMSRAREDLDQYEEASRLAADALRFADSIGDEALAADSLQSLANQVWSLGRLPEALAHFQRIEHIYRQQEKTAYLPSVWLNQAELLIELGHGLEAEARLAEVERSMRAGAEPDARVRRRVARLRAFRAVTEGRFAEGARHAAQARGAPGSAPDSTALIAKVLAEYARARLGIPGTPPDALASWPEEAASTVQRRDLGFRVAETLRLRNEASLAIRVAQAAWSAPRGDANPEVRWRLAAVASLAGRLTGEPLTIPGGAAQEEAGKLRDLWAGYDAAPYFGRADLKVLVGAEIR